MKMWFVVLIILLIVLTIASGCSSPANSPTPPVTSSQSKGTVANQSPLTTAASNAPKSGGTFTLIDPKVPSTTLGWFAQTGNAMGPYTFPMVETLLRADYYGNITPMLAESYQVASDLKSITLNIRKGVKFHDGTTMDGAAVKWNLDQMLAAKLGPTVIWASIDLVDDYTVRINLKEYRNTVLNDLASSTGTIVSPSAFNAKGMDFIRWNPVGTGPFKFVSFERDVSVKTTKFADYWQKGKPYLDAVEVHFVADPMTQSAAFQVKEADALGGDLGKVAYDLQQAGYPVIKNSSGAISLVGDSANPDSPFSKLQVRQALDYAIDRDSITKARGFGFQQPLFQLALPGTPNYITDLQNRSFNPDKAKQLLAEAGFPAGFKTTLICDSASCDREAMTAIQSYLSKVGIDAEFVWADNAGYIKARTTGWTNALLAGGIGIDANTNSAIARTFIRATATYSSMIKSDDMENMYSTSVSSKQYDPVLMQKIIRYLYDNALINVLWTTARGDVVQPYVHDTGFMSMQTWPGWTPENTWLSK